MNQFIYKGTGIEMTDALSSYVEKRMTSLFSKYDILEKQIHIELAKSTNHHKNGEIYFAEARFRTNTKSIFARSQKSDIYEAIDHLSQEVSAQLEGSKGKAFTLFKRGAQKIKNMLRFWEK
jgi:ribosomal subunit interface protein